MPYTREGIGYQGRDTSMNAANSNVKGRQTIRDQVYEALASSPLPLSTEELAEKIGKPFASVQPRTSELCNDGRICDSGKRGRTQWGKACILWGVT
jgi:hypothetical protein